MKLASFLKCAQKRYNFDIGDPSVTSHLRKVYTYVYHNFPSDMRSSILKEHLQYGIPADGEVRAHPAGIAMKHEQKRVFCGKQGLTKIMKLIEAESVDDEQKRAKRHIFGHVQILEKKIICPKCGSMETMSIQRQTRALDEVAKSILLCHDCGCEF